MEKLNTQRISKTTGWTFAAIHAAVVLALQAGIWDYWQWAHMMNMQISVSPFNAVTFITGTATAGIVGLLVGAVFASVYNRTR